MTSIFIDSIFTEKIRVPPKFISSKLNNYILKKLENYEEKCSKYGYIQKNSIVINSISLGSIDYTSLQGFVLYTVKFKVKVCNPIIGSIIGCTVDSINQFGILCSVKSETNKTILEIIIPKKCVTIKSNIDLSNIKINDKVSLKLLGKKFHINDTNISGIGTIVNVIKSDSSDESELDSIKLDESELNLIEENKLNIRNETELDENELISDNESNDSGNESENESVNDSDIEIESDNENIDIELPKKKSIRSLDEKSDSNSVDLEVDDTNSVDLDIEVDDSDLEVDEY